MRLRLRGLTLFLLACLNLVALPASSITFNVSPDVRKCIREEVHKDVLVVGDYKFSDVTGQTTDIKVYY